MFETRGGRNRARPQIRLDCRRRACRLHRTHPLAVDDAGGLPEEHAAARERGMPASVEIDRALPARASRGWTRQPRRRC